MIKGSGEIQLKSNNILQSHFFHRKINWLMFDLNFGLCTLKSIFNRGIAFEESYNFINYNYFLVQFQPQKWLLTIFLNEIQIQHSQICVSLENWWFCNYFSASFQPQKRHWARILAAIWMVKISIQWFIIL